MPLPFALPVGLLLGITLAWLSRVELTRADAPLLFARPFLVALGFGALVFAPVVGYFAALHGDWSYLYLLRWGRVPSAVDVILVFFAGLQVPLGFALAAPWAIAKRGTLFAQVSGALLALLAIAFAICARRLEVSGSYAQYHGAFGTAPVSRSPLGRGILLSWLALSLAFAWSIHVLRPLRAR